MQEMWDCYMDGGQQEDGGFKFLAVLSKMETNCFDKPEHSEVHHTDGPRNVLMCCFTL